MSSRSFTRRAFVRCLLALPISVAVGNLAGCAAPAPQATATKAAAAATSAVSSPVAVATAAPAAPTAAAKPKTLEQVGVRLAWLGNSNYSALYAGLEKGFFKEEGLDVVVREGGPGQNAVVLVGAGKDDVFGIANSSSSIISARASSTPVDVIGIGAMIQSNPYGYIRLVKPGTPEPTPKDIVGKKIGVAAGDEIHATALALKNGIDPKSFTLVTVGSTPAMLLTGDVDWYAGWVIDRPWVIERELKAAGRTEIPQWLLFQKWASPSLAQVLFCTTRTVKERPDVVRGFVKATARSVEYMIKNPKEAVPLVMKRQSTDPAEMVEWAIGEISNLAVNADTKANGLLWMNPQVWQAHMDYLFDNKKIDKKIPLDQAMTNQFVVDTPKL